MISLLVGLSAYLVSGTMTLIFRKWRFWISLSGWAGALVGLIFTSITYRNSGSTIGSLGPWGQLGIEIKIDQTTVLFLILAVALNLFTLLYLKGKKPATFYSLYNLLFATSFSWAFTNDLFNLYVIIELMSLISILLIGYDRKTYQIYAGIKYLLLSSLSMSLYLIGLAILYKTAGHLGISSVKAHLGAEPEFAVTLALTLMITGLAVKGGVLLFSMWLPDAHSYSSTVVSALLSGMAIKCGLIDIIRLSVLTDMSEALLVLGLITGIGGTTFAVIEKFPKRLLAYSTISQVGYILLGISMGTDLGITAASFHILFHGLSKSLLFVAVGHGKVGRIDLHQVNKVSLPIASKLGLLAGSLSILAIPPLDGYFSKCLLLDTVGHSWTWIVVLFIGLGTALSFVKLNWALLPGPTKGKFRLDDLSLIVYALIVSVGGGITLFFLSRTYIRHLFCLEYIEESIAILLIAILLYWLFKKPISKIRSPDFVFDLDSSLISLFTGFLLVIFLWL